MTVGAGTTPLTHQVNVPRGIGGQPVELAGTFLEAGTGESCAYDRLVIEAVREPQARQEVGNAIVLVVKGAAVAVLPGKLDLAGIHAEIRCPSRRNVQFTTVAG